MLAQTFLEEFNVSEELSSARLTAVLDLPEVAFPIGQRNIATGTQTLGGAAAFTVDAGTNTLDYCNQINLAEQGRLYMARAGDLTFEADQVVNRAAVQILGNNTLEVADDAASQAKYFIQNKLNKIGRASCRERV